MADDPTPEEPLRLLPGERVAVDVTPDAAPRDPVAWGRPETDPCERGTVGCSVRHVTDSPCETW